MSIRLMDGKKQNDRHTVYTVEYSSIQNIHVLPTMNSSQDYCLTLHKTI